MCLSYVFHGRFFLFGTCDGNHLFRLAFFLVTGKPGFLGTGVVQQPSGGSRCAVFFGSLRGIGFVVGE